MEPSSCEGGVPRGWMFWLGGVWKNGGGVVWLLYRVKRGVTLLFRHFELGTKLGTVGRKKKREIISHCII